MLTKLHSRAIHQLHRGNSGLVRINALVQTFWWPCIDKAVEKSAKAVHYWLSPAKAPLNPWIWPTVSWKGVHVDVAGPLTVKMLFTSIKAH